MQFIAEIPPSIFYFLSDAQIAGLNISQASKEQIENLFSRKSGTGDDERRFALLPADQVNAILDKLNGYHMYLLSDEHLKQLDVSKLTESHLEPMFSCKNGTGEDERRFALLPADQVNAILDKLNGYRMYLLSDEHLKQLDVSKLTEYHLQLLFNAKNGLNEDKKRFAFLPADQVNAILDKLNGYQMYLLSDEHLKQLNVSKLTEIHLQPLFNAKNGLNEDKRRFALLPADQVNAILHKLNGYQMYLLSDEHLEKLDLSKLTEKHLQLMFSAKNGTQEDKRRFALFSKDQVNIIINKLNKYQASLLSKE